MFGTSVVIGAMTAFMLLLLATGCGSGSSSQVSALSAETTQAIAELDAAPAPEGVDEGIYAMLKAELRDALLRRTSTPPSGADNAIGDLVLFDAGTEEWTLEWSYRNVGDYNQNGRVGIEDITPLAQHFGQDVPTDDTDRISIQAVIDGSGNGRIGIEDVTPIAQNFNVEVNGYTIDVSATEGAEWDEVDTVLQSAASGDERKSLEFLLDAPTERSLYRVRAYDAGQAAFGDPSNPVRFYTLDLTLTLVTPAEGGDGSAEEPFIVMEGDPYELQATYGVEDVSAEMGFSTMPPAFISFTAESPRLLTVDNVMAGDFYVIGLLGELAPIESGRLYFRVQGDLPP